MSQIINQLLLLRNKLLLSEKLTGDILWNLISFAVIAVNGLVLNILIVSIYDTAALGLFNQIYAVFIILSQLSVNGIHFSVLKSISLGGTQKEIARTFTSALVLTFTVALIVAGLIYPFTSLASTIFESQYMTPGIRLVMPGLVFFALNKVILAFLNGQRKMKLFALYQGLRSIFMLGFLLIFTWSIHDGNAISIIFSFSEGLIFLCLLPVIYRNISLRFDRKLMHNAIQHFKYGLKATGGNILLELNTKLDVLILGLFVSDSQVGLYSFAALFIEGFSQLPLIIRNNINPLLAEKFHQPTLDDFKHFVKKVIRISYMVFIPIGIIGILAFPLVGYLKADIDIEKAWLYFVIMLGGLLIASGYMPLLMVFNQAGKPGIQSLVLLSTTLVLSVSLLILTSSMGTLGAAIGMGLTFVIQAAIIGAFLNNILLKKNH